MLIADDEEDMRILLRIAFAMDGGDLTVVAEAADGADALARWRAMDSKPDVVVLDHRMPGMTGLDVAAAMLAELPTQPIVIVSSYLAPDVRWQAARLGVGLCLGKQDLTLLPGLIRKGW